MELYNVAAYTETSSDLPKVVNEKHQTGKLSKSFPAKYDGRGNEMSLWTAQTRKLELQSNDP